MKLNKHPEWLGYVKTTVASYRQSVLSGQYPYYQFDPQLGWTITPHGRHASLPYTADELGFRKTSLDSCEPEAPCIAFWGDSLCHGDEVSDKNTWLWQLQDRLKEKYRVVNGGVSGYGCDQALLRFQRCAHKIDARINILTYATTDLFRHINIHRYFLNSAGDFPFLKPRFIFKNGRLQLLSPPESTLENLVDLLSSPDTGRHLRQYDAFYPTLPEQIKEKLRQKVFRVPPVRFYVTKVREALKVTSGIFDQFYRQCDDQCCLGMILFLPMYQGQWQAGRDFDWLMEHLDRRGAPYIDLRKIFNQQNHDSDIFTARNHYTSLSGSWIAQELATFFEKSNVPIKDLN